MEGHCICRQQKHNEANALEWNWLLFFLSLVKSAEYSELKSLEKFVAKRDNFDSFVVSTKNFNFCRNSINFFQNPKEFQVASQPLETARKSDWLYVQQCSKDAIWRSRAVMNGWISIAITQSTNRGWFCVPTATLIYNQLQTSCSLCKRTHWE